MSFFFPVFVSFLRLSIITYRHDGSFGPDSNVEVPNVTYKDFTVIGINEDGFLSLLDDDGVTYDDLKVPMGTLGDNIREAFENGKEVPVSIWNFFFFFKIMMFQRAKF